MSDHPRNTFLFSIVSLLYAGLLFVFYLKYVPWVNSYQRILLPLVGGIFLLTVFNARSGTLLLLFLLPLINTLPLFSGITREIPQAPATLTLFLFYYFGWLVRRSIFADEDKSPSPLTKPLALFAAFVLISAVFTFFRLTDFFPFRADAIYEFITNVNGVSAGGAIMSTVFHASNYLCGIAFFFILLKLMKSKSFLKMSLPVLSAGLFLSILVGYIQAYKDISLGNDPFWAGIGQINGTFIDPNAFGAVSSALLPLIFGLILVSKKGIRLYYGILFALILFLYPQIGTRSGFLGLIAALTFFSLAVLSHYRKLKLIHLRKGLLWGTGILIVPILLLALFFIQQSRLASRLESSVSLFNEKYGIVGLSPERFFLWKEALFMVKDYPLSGVGVGSYIIELPNYYQKDNRKTDTELLGWQRNDSAENYFFHIAAETGLAGTALIVWIFGLIFIRARAALKEDRNKTDKIFLIGTVAGLLSCFVNFIFHTYIGSFETKLVFWFLVALLFSKAISSAEKEEVQTERQRHRPLFVLSGVLLLFVFGVSHLWNSTHGLSLKSRTAAFGLTQEFGFDRIEQNSTGKEFRWTKKNAAQTLLVEKPLLEFSLLASHPDIEQNPVSVEIYVIQDFFKDKTLLDRLVLNKNEWKSVSYPVAGYLGQKVLLLFKVSRTWNPLKTLGTSDPRNLGVAVGNIVFKEK